MSVLQRIRRDVSPGSILYTPSKRVPFIVESVNEEGVTSIVGAGGWKIKVSKECLEGIPDYLRNKGWVKVGAVHNTAEKGSLEDYLDKYVSRSSSSYVVPLLERINLIEVKHGRPVKIRLIE